MDQTQSIQERFGAAAAAYAVSAVHRGGPDLDAMLAAGVATGRERVLDLGCGPATPRSRSRRTSRRWSRSTSRQAMLEQARRLAAERGIAEPALRAGRRRAAPFPTRASTSSPRGSRRITRRSGARCCARSARVLAPRRRLPARRHVAPEDPAQDSFLNAFELLRDPSHVRDHRISRVVRRCFAPRASRRSVLGRFTIHQEFDAWVERDRDVGRRA